MRWVGWRKIVACGSVTGETDDCDLTASAASSRLIKTEIGKQIVVARR